MSNQTSENNKQGVLASTKTGDAPTIKVSSLRGKLQSPVCVSLKGSLKEAVTTMLIHDYSQLPVVSKGKILRGYISWKSIVEAQMHGTESGIIKDYYKSDKPTINFDTPLLDAIHFVYQNEFSIVLDDNQHICGIITVTDISQQYLKLTEPYLLIKEIETYIRQLINIFTLEDILPFIKEEDRPNITSIDDLNFGYYVRILENRDMWNKLSLNVDRTAFTNALDEIRKIRNDLMHFRPEGISSTRQAMLVNMERYLSSMTHNG